MSRNTMSGANQDAEKFSLCLHRRRFFRVLIHRADARKPVDPKDSPAALGVWIHRIRAADSMQEGNG